MLAEYVKFNKGTAGWEIWLYWNSNTFFIYPFIISYFDSFFNIT